MKTHLLPALIITLSLLLAFSLLSNDHEWGDDWASYVMQAEAIVRHDPQGFVQRNAFTMRTSTHFLGPDAYPWGYPLLLAPLVRLCGAHNLFCLKHLNPPLYTLFLIALYALLRRRLPPAESTLLMAVFAFSHVILPFNDLLQSEIAFLATSTLSLLLIDQTCRDPNPAPLRSLILGGILYLAFFIRTNGILLLPTLFLAQIASLPRRASSRFLPDLSRARPTQAIPYLVFFLLVLMERLLLPSGESLHLARLQEISTASLLKNLIAYLGMAAYFFENLRYPFILYGFILPFILSGLLLYGQRDLPLAAYLLLSYLLFILWPEQQGVRFLFPLLPLIVYFAWRGMEASHFALAGHHPRLGMALARLFWLIVILGFAWNSVDLARQNLARGRGHNGNVLDPLSLEMFDFIRTQTPADAVIAFYKPRALRLFTDRNTLLIDDCRALPLADYAVLRKSRGGLDQIAPAVIDTCNPTVQVERLFENHKFVIYHLTRQNTPSP